MWLHAAFYDGRNDRKFIVLDMYIDKNKVFTSYDTLKPLRVNDIPTIISYCSAVGEEILSMQNQLW